jgi:hypothetical protein
MGTRNDFFEICRVFGHVPSKKVSQPCFMTFFTIERKVCLSELNHMQFLRHNTCSDFQILLMSCLSYVLHMQSLTYHKHVISLLSYIFRFCTRGLSQISQIIRFSYITTYVLPQILCPSTLSAITSVPFLRYHACAASHIYRTCLFCNISRMESPQLLHMFSFQVSRVCAVCCVLSEMSKHFNTKFHGNVKWCRTKVPHILCLGLNGTELSVSQPGTFTSGELTPVQTRLAPGLVLEPSQKR